MITFSHGLTQIKYGFSFLLHNNPFSSVIISGQIIIRHLSVAGEESGNNIVVINYKNNCLCYELSQTQISHQAAA